MRQRRSKALAHPPLVQGPSRNPSYLAGSIARAALAFAGQKGVQLRPADHDQTIGLALVAQVVRRHGGTIEAGRSTMGGAVFSVRIGDEP